MYALNWVKCQGEVWCSLNTVNLPHPHFDNLEGVYVIWHGGPTPKTVYVGSGNIRQRLTDHRQNPEIQQFQNLGLFVTWAAVTGVTMRGAEVYLATSLNPLVGQRYPQVAPVQVNAPW